ncbi:MAG: DNA repair protein RecO [Chloroflexi bacterium]|nr:DNA repair protein RecO [Chloroflexota bacterium]MBI3762135.1 DNA repair protein RecO [Chloroflexota bacterium]
MPRERVYRTEAIVLRRRDFGEADRLLTLYTPERGKMNALAKGARKPTSRKAGHVELYIRSELLLAQGRDLDIVTQAETVDSYRPLREDLLRTSYASYCVELLDKFTVENVENQPLYELLGAALGWICTARDLQLTTRYYELQLLSLVGYQPELYRCVSRGEVIQAEDQFFSVADGGVLCPACGPQRPGAVPISQAALKLMRYFQSNSYDRVAALNVRPLVHAELERVLHRYITYILERQLKSVQFLRLVRREA